MSDDAAAPEGISLAEFKSVSLDVGSWIWGTLQGAFNEKQSVSQIIVDAVIGMIPLVGDATAIRDLIAVIIGLVQDPRKREDKFQWMLLVILICALIPVFGGAIKGVGRILVHVMGEVAQIAEKSARGAKLLEAARDMIALCNRLGVGNAEKWLKELQFAKYQDQIMKHINELLVRLDDVLKVIQTKVTSWVVPAVVKDKVIALRDAMATVKKLISEKIPDAIKQLDQDLRELQALVHSGGETTSRAVSHTATAGAKNLSHTEELILLEGKDATRSARGGFAKNAGRSDRAGATYKYEPGFPDLRKDPLPGAKPGLSEWEDVTTFSGLIVNRPLEEGDKIYRVFGPGGTTHGFPVKPSAAAGSPKKTGPAFWGLGEVPPNANEWRQGSAVLDEWNHDGFIVIGEILPGHSVPACTGVIAEQSGSKIGAQYLRGGNKQAMLQIADDAKKELNALAEKVQLSGVAEKKVIGGISWEVRPTGWSDVNGVHGYLRMPGPGTVQTVRMGARELASKRNQNGSN
jgi:hypothetical protein